MSIRSLSKNLNQSLSNNTPSIDVVRPVYKTSKYMGSNPPDFFLSRVSKHGASGYYRENMFGYEIVWGGCLYTFDNAKNKKKKVNPKKHLFIFSLVKRDAEKYAKLHKIEPTDWLPSIEYNENAEIKHRQIVGTDVDGAYWRIAYKMGVISEKTYQHGLRIQNKSLCLSALASLGADKSYLMIENGKITNKIKTIRGSKVLKEVYRMIRFTCFDYMRELAVILGDDFVCYKTDCIYYFRNQENLSIVKQFLKDRKLDFKMIDGYNRLTMKA